MKRKRNEASEGAYMTESPTVGYGFDKNTTTGESVILAPENIRMLTNDIILIIFIWKSAEPKNFSRSLKGMT